MLQAFQLNDQEISPELYSDALALSHLARSVLDASCDALQKRTGSPPVARTPSQCAIDPQFMDRFGDQDTLRTMSTLYRRVASALGLTGEANRQLELLTPASAAGFAFDMVGRVTGTPPSIRVTGFERTKPFFEEFLREGPGAGLPSRPPSEPQGKSAKSILLPVVGVIALLGIGVGAGIFFARR